MCKYLTFLINEEVKNFLNIDSAVYNFYDQPNNFPLIF